MAGCVHAPGGLAAVVSGVAPRDLLAVLAVMVPLPWVIPWLRQRLWSSGGDEVARRVFRNCRVRRLTLRRAAVSCAACAGRGLMTGRIPGRRQEEHPGVSHAGTGVGVAVRRPHQFVAYPFLPPYDCARHAVAPGLRRWVRCHERCTITAAVGAAMWMWHRKSCPP